MGIFRNPELKGIMTILLIAFILGVLLAGTSGKLEQWGLPWFTGAKALDKIVFVSDRSGTKQVYVMDLDGSDQKQLTSDIKVLSAPAISPAGNRIAFVGMTDSASQVFAIGVNGGSPRALTTSANSKRQPGFSPDGKKLSYIEAGRVFVAELNGGNPDPVLPTEQEMAMAINDPSGGRGTIPVYTMYAWGPDSESLAGVTGGISGETLVYLPSPEGEAQRFNLGDPTAKVVGLSWAVDRPLLAASIQVSQTQGMVVLFDPDRKQPQIVYSTSERVGAPAISPDGSVIVVPVSHKTIDLPKGALLKIDLQSQKPKPVALCEGESLYENPVFSPSGSSILASQSGPLSTKRRIVSIDAESGKITQLTNKGDNFGAVWTPQSP